jgi:hypothetical protein
MRVSRQLVRWGDAWGHEARDGPSVTGRKPGVIAQEQPEEEARRATGEPGQGDEVHSTEVTSDPDEGPDDPGRGPGITWER